MEVMVHQGYQGEAGAHLPVGKNITSSELQTAIEPCTDRLSDVNWSEHMLRGCQKTWSDCMSCLIACLPWHGVHRWYHPPP